ncbi:MAG TPA: adenylate/guanylate cyclase domain-containing protein [Burkholderiaceae bacterium]|nr:adenylate/guanylate cyclase domain-containing protein [Burkholderiaceae bacterium]
MKDDSSTAAVRSLQALIERETGTMLRPAVESEIAAIVHKARSAANAGTSDLSVERREVTILLADLRGFTALSATQPSGTVITMLNKCLGRMSEVVFRYQGTIDKFMGDSIMVLFGAPYEHDDDAARAMACAIEMQMAMRELNNEYQRSRMPELYMGIGINTGSVMAGRFGSDAYSEYTVIGNEVNLASRIEAFSLRGQVLVSESTYQRCSSSVLVTDPMEVYVKGKSQPVRLRELIAIPSRKLKVPRQEFRRSHRVEVKIPCTLQLIQNKIVVPHAIKAYIRDIGYHGVLLEVDHLLEHHVEVKLEFDLPLVDFKVSDIYAKVVKLKRDSDHLMAGLEFTSIDSETNMKIQMFVQLLVGAQ